MKKDRNEFIAQYHVLHDFSLSYVCQAELWLYFRPPMVHLSPRGVCALSPEDPLGLEVVNQELIGYRRPGTAVHLWQIAVRSRDGRDIYYVNVWFNCKIGLWLSGAALY